MNRPTIPAPAHRRLKPFIDAYIRRLPDNLRAEVDNGEITTALVSDGVVHVLEVAFVHPSGVYPWMRLDPVKVGLHAFEDGTWAYVPSDDG